MSKQNSSRWGIGVLGLLGVWLAGAAIGFGARGVRWEPSWVDEGAAAAGTGRGGSSGVVSGLAG